MKSNSHSIMHFNFVASDHLEPNDFNDIASFVSRFPDFQNVPLENEHALNQLLELIGIKNPPVRVLGKAPFEKIWDLSHIQLPEYNNEQFEAFYKEWLEKTGRDNTMDEYASLIFLQGKSREWNRLDYRLIVKEESS